MLQSGDRIASRLVVEGRLASGGMAEVFVARLELPRGLSRRVAVKRIHAHLAEDGHFVDMFLDEARIVSQLSHPGIVPILDVVEYEGQLMIILDYVAGWDLAALLKAAKQQRTAVPIAIAVRVARDLFETLSYVHGAADERGVALNIVHRDVTPSNILLGADGSVRLLDFGVAKAAQRVVRTATFGLKGKLAYMAPEQASARGVDARTDLYAGGIVLFEMLSGRRAFQASSEIELIELVRSPTLPRVETLRTDIPPALAALTGALLAPDPGERPESAARVVTELADLPAASAEAVSQFTSQLLGASERPITRVHREFERALLLGAADATGATLAAEDANAPRSLLYGTRTPAGRQRAHPSQARDDGVTTRPIEAASSVREPSRRSRGRLVAGVVAFATLAGGVVLATLVLGTTEPLASEDRPSATAEAVAFLQIATVPAGARVRIGDRLLEERSPLVTRLPPGPVELTIEREDHVTERRRLELAPGETARLDVELSRVAGTVELGTRPSGARVLVDGAARGSTPVTLTELPRVPTRVRLELDGYAPHEEVLDLDSSAHVTRDVVLERPRLVLGELWVNADVLAAQVSVDGRTVCTEMPCRARIPAGQHRVQVMDPTSGRSTQRSVRIEPSRIERLGVFLNRRP